MFGKKLSYTGFAVLITGALLSGCSSASTSGKTNSASNNSSTNNSAIGKNSSTTTNNSPASTSNPVSTKVSWPSVSLTRIGKLPHGVEGTTLAWSPQGPVSVGGYTGLASLTGIYQLLPRPVQIAQLPARTHDAAAAYMHQNLYVFGGGQATSYNTIVRAHSGAGKVIAHLSAPLSDAAAVPLTWHGQPAIAVMGGYDGSVFRKQAQLFTEQNGHFKAQPLFSLPTPVRYPAVTADNGNVYLVGGQKTQGLSNRVYMWSPQTGIKQTAVTLSHGLQKAAAFVTGNYLVVIGGESSSGTPQQTITAYNLRTGKSKTVGKVPGGLADMGYVQHGNVGYLAGGVSSASSRPTAVIWKVELQ